MNYCDASPEFALEVCLSSLRLFFFFCLLPTRISKQLRLPGWVAKRDIFHSSSGEEVLPYVRTRHSKWLDMVPCVRTRHSPWLDTVLCIRTRHSPWLDMVPCVRTRHLPWLDMEPHPLQALQSLCLICSNLSFISITSSQNGCDMMRWLDQG